MHPGIVANLARAGTRSISSINRKWPGILAMLRTVSVLVDARDRAEALVRGYEERLEAVAGQSRRRPRSRVYTEEWDEPLIAGIRWMSVLVRIACSDDVFPELARQPAAKYRIVTPEAVSACRPEVILASWCGKKMVPSRIASRPGWSSMPTVEERRIVEIESPLILQPGPVALTDGLDAILRALAAPINRPTAPISVDGHA